MDWKALTLVGETVRALYFLLLNISEWFYVDLEKGWEQYTLAAIPLGQQGMREGCFSRAAAEH